MVENAMKNTNTCGADFGFFGQKVIVICGFLASGVACASPIDDLRALTKDLRTLSGEFSQTTQEKSGKPGKNLSGTFAIATGGKFRFDYAKPYKQVLVSDGSKFSTYDEDLAQMTVRKLDQSLAATPLAVLTGAASVDSVFKLTEEKPADGLSWVSAMPKQSDAAVGDLRFGLQGATLKAIAWSDAFGQRITMKFPTITKNSVLPAAQFSFTPPTGTDIVGQ